MYTGTNHYDIKVQTTIIVHGVFKMNRGSPPPPAHEVATKAR